MNGFNLQMRAFPLNFIISYNGLGMFEPYLFIYLFMYLFIYVMYFLVDFVLCFFLQMYEDVYKLF
jgi:hypothetical protein